MSNFSSITAVSIVIRWTCKSLNVISDGNDNTFALDRSVRILYSFCFTDRGSVRTQIVSNQIYLRQKEHNATQKKQSKYVDRTQRQYETALTSALQNKNTTTGI